MISKHFQFIIPLSTSQYMERMSFSKLIRYRVILWKSKIIVCTRQLSKDTYCIQEWIDYWDRISLGKFLPWEDQEQPLRKRSSGQVSRLKQTVCVWIGQPTGWEINYLYRVRDYQFLNFYFRGAHVAPHQTSEQQ